MNSKTPASVKSIMTLYSSLKFSSVVSRNADFHKRVACVRFDVFPGELVSSSALIRVTFLSQVSVSGNIFEQAPSCILFQSRRNAKIISRNLISTNLLISKKLSPTVKF